MVTANEILSISDAAPRGHDEDYPSPLELTTRPALLPSQQFQIRYSRGGNRYDNAPEQRAAEDFETFARAVANDQCTSKGQQFICSAFRKGSHDDSNKYQGLNHWRLKKLAGNRRFLPVDYDGFKSTEAFERWSQFLKRYSCVAYTTASHKPEAPRSRAIFELSRDVTREESLQLGIAFEGVQQHFLGINFAIFDKSVYQHEQPCYLPLVSSEVCIYRGKPLDVDTLLKQAPPSNRAESGAPAARIKDPVTMALAGLTPLEETPANVQKVENALAHIDPDGHYQEIWFPTLCAVKSLGWSCSEELARAYSARGEKYKEDKFKRQWNAIKEDKGITIGTLFHIANQRGWTPETLNGGIQSGTPASAGKPQRSRFTLLTPSEIKALLPVAQRIKGILPQQGLASVFGASSSGKTFLVLSMGAHLCRGEKWFGYTVKACPVVYVALEGSYGISNRLRAWEKHHGIAMPDTFRLVTDHLSLFEGGHIESFADQVLGENVSGGVIIIDTLNQSAPEADENTSKDMGRIISNAQRLQKLTDSLVILVHHSGKDQSKGLRGHSSLNAALDAAIEVRNDANGRSWGLTKSKDGEYGISFPFRLEVITLGKDEEGDAISSCVALPDTNARPKRAIAPKGHNQKIALKAIRDALSNVGNGGGQPSIPLEAATTLAATAIPCEDKRKRERAQTAINGLVAADILILQNGGVRLP